MYKYSKLPKKIEKEEYDRQQQGFVNFLEDMPSVISLYSIGELWLYGVSDLDYLIVYEWQVDEGIINDFIGAYNLIDTVLFLNINHIDTKSYISHHMTYSLVHGKDLWLSFEKNNTNLNIIYAWRVCFFSLLRNFYFYKYNKEIYVKNLLSQINDIRYPIFFLENLGIKNKKYNDFLERFTAYRESYFTHKENQKLDDFLDEAIVLSWDIASELETYLPKREKKSFFYGRFPTVFQDFSDMKTYQKMTERKLRYIWKFSRFLYLPIWFDFRNWDGSLEKDLEQIVKNNTSFLNFSLPSFKWKILLVLKRVFDFVLLKTF